MAAAAILFFVIPSVLLLVGAITAWRAVAGLRAGAAGTAPSVLRLVAGIVTWGAAILALAPLWSDMTYGVIILPAVALMIAVVTNAVLLGLAALLAPRADEHTSGSGA
jgi:hypothetical protein